jgi:glycosyltransferase involved in cell wall biosynthesis
LVPVGDAGAFAHAILQLTADPARHQALRTAARADAVARFSPEPLLDQYEALYRRVLVKRAANNLPR